MKADKRPDIERLVSAPPPDMRLFLFYGADEGGARAAASKLAGNVADEGSEGGKLHLSPSRLKEDPSILADEAAAISMFGGRKVLWVEPVAGAAANSVIPACEALLEAGEAGNPAVLIAGDLKATHALVKLAGGSGRAAALRFYMPDARQAGAIVRELCAAAGLEPTPSAAARLTETALASRAVAEREIEKYALFLGAEPDAPQPLDDDTLDKLGAAFAEATFQQLVDAVLGGKPAASAREQKRLSAEGKVAVAQVRALQRRVMQLVELGAGKPGGQSASSYLDSLGRRIFWKDKPSLARQMDIWPAAEAERALSRLVTLERELKSSGSVDAELRAANMFLALARFGERRARRNVR